MKMNFDICYTGKMSNIRIGFYLIFQSTKTVC